MIRLPPEREEMMVERVGRIREIAIAVSPAIFVLTFMSIVLSVNGHTKSLFFAHSIGSIPLRFIIITFIFISPILIIPKLLAITFAIMKNERFSLKLVTAHIEADRKLSRFVAWFLRPLQGISLALILAERFLNMLEASIPLLPGTYTKLLVSDSFFLLLTSVFLSVVWAFDDLGIMIYNRKTAEVRMVGSSIGTFLPLITGAIGVSALYHSSLSPFSALIYLVEIVMVLYPSYVIFIVLQHGFVMARSSVLLSKLKLDRIETQFLKITLATDQHYPLR